jgi:hypothetical protein
MSRLDRVLIFLGFLILTLLTLFFFTYLNELSLNYILIGLSVLSFFITMFDFLRKK